MCRECILEPSGRVEVDQVRIEPAQDGESPRMNKSVRLPSQVERLLARGVVISSPHTVEIDESVVPERIAPGVRIHAGCRITGADTSIGPGSEIGREAPVTIEACQLGHRVELRGGYVSGATFLDGANMGSGAHVRPGTLLEEEAGAAHTVGFKQTIFLSYVTAGSLINFCDALMAGGTSRKNHSEIGSSYIHFNFTPRQDKATPSLVGDVARGVFLDQAPIFLGGQGGLVGPARVAYGTVIPAGTVWRDDILEEGWIAAAPRAAAEARAFAPGIYRAIRRVVVNNLLYIGNLWALREWYLRVRIGSMGGDPYREACRAGALARIGEGLEERVKRLGELADKMKYSLRHARTATGAELPDGVRQEQRALLERWPEMKARLETGPPEGGGVLQRDAFLEEWEGMDLSSGHCGAVGALSPRARAEGSAWLKGIVEGAGALWTDH